MNSVIQQRYAARRTNRINVVTSDDDTEEESNSNLEEEELMPDNNSECSVAPDDSSLGGTEEFDVPSAVAREEEESSEDSDDFHRNDSDVFAAVEEESSEDDLSEELGSDVDVYFHGGRHSTLPTDSKKILQLRSTFREKKYEWHPNLKDAFEKHTCEADSGGMCSILEFLGLLHLPDLKTLLCFQHASLLPCECVKSHLYDYHYFNFISKKNKLLEDVSSHLLEVLGANISVSMSDLRANLPAKLPEPLFVENQARTIRRRFQCPVCQKWITGNENYRGGRDVELRKHLAEIHQQKLFPATSSIAEAWCQHLKLASKTPGNFQHVFELSTYSPSPEQMKLNPAFSLKTKEAPLHSKWFLDLKWPEQRRELLDLVTFSEVQCLISLPSHQLMYSANSKLDKAIETGLVLVRKALTLYFKNAQEFLSSLHPLVRSSMRPR